MTLRRGDRVRIDIPDERDPDFDLDGEHALVIAIDHDHYSGGYEVSLENYEFTVEMYPVTSDHQSSRHYARNPLVLGYRMASSILE